MALEKFKNWVQNEPIEKITTALKEEYGVEFESNFEIGERVIVYDSKIWNRYGKDIGHNEHCLQVAIIENIRYNVPSVSHDYIYPILYDVIFMYDGRLSKGHLDVHKIDKVINIPISL